MSKIATIKKGFRYLTDSGYRMGIDTKHGRYAHLSDQEYISLRYKRCLKRTLNLDKPESFNEKLQWLKLFDRQPKYTMLVDKFAVKQFITEKIGDQYVVPTLGVWDKFEDIDFESLPNQFVLKCTHDSGGIVICRDKQKFNKKKAKTKLNRLLASNFYTRCREWPYKNVHRRIIAEEYLEDSVECDLKDYKLMCFNGKVRCSFVCTDRFSNAGVHVTFFDRNWNRMPFQRHYPTSKKVISKPLNYDEMIRLAEELSKDIPFVRVDFYEVNGKIYFGEMTFYPGSGYEEFEPDEWDYTLGSWITLPLEKTTD